MLTAWPRADELGNEGRGERRARSFRTESACCEANSVDLPIRSPTDEAVGGPREGDVSEDGQRRRKDVRKNNRGHNTPGKEDREALCQESMGHIGNGAQVQTVLQKWGVVLRAV